uniref:Nucleotide-diphospho-sugar transferase domain-containing protein n=1 Tax=Dunaliella tertiolecta TaxID=3047 RepID=A0A7S3RAL4_DUNTE|mmetsp:Transcript_21531/g.59659  ORF Transcript_21531/g.59659 Transcript_21531/m.59659 type:complete len:373 (+) Transcript_21531:149-1267(+)|eukprot:CAMPEP_0202352474 /NCGR_PEP_ID=MMETSP1126-20121109/8656_1 /ASSEMBLY_ACC=CAM_ASM_000457 /TAXON_ID=3047 /ORGANISM="Dunaliella tertiolecta, Strain CCMP1320" /LENGTH=372 /DNA_ID=CAMNT_0048944701 /DNA_START=109 /DNA_END=1227 /DNA_ORIENTATION=+
MAARPPCPASAKGPLTLCRLLFPLLLLFHLKACSAAMGPAAGDQLVMAPAASEQRTLAPAASEQRNRTRAAGRQRPRPPEFRSPVTYSEEDKAWAQEFGQFAKGVSLKPSSCVPDNTVIHTMSNSIDWKMVELQTRRIASQECFFIRFVIITLDDRAHAACTSNPALQCSRYFRNYGRAEYLQGSYIEVVFLKLKSLLSIVNQGITAYFFDADVLFYHVPQFPPAHTFDIILQADAYDLPCEFKSIPKTDNPPFVRPECVRPSVFNLSTNTGQIGISSEFKQAARFLEDVIMCGVRMKARRGNQFCFKVAIRRMPSVRLVHLSSRYADHRWAKHYLNDTKIKFMTYHAVLGHAGRAASNKYEVLLKALARPE